jgi:ribosomal protein S18 acetylase RimI-like enzyme
MTPVRVAANGDFEAVDDLLEAVFLRSGLVPGLPADAVRNSRRRAQDALVCVATDHDEIVGTATLAKHGTGFATIAGEAEIEMRLLGVAPKARQRGIGRSLVEWCVARASQEGPARLVLWTRPQMQEAQRLYESCGFNRSRRFDHLLPLIGYERDLRR